MILLTIQMREYYKIKSLAGSESRSSAPPNSLHTCMYGKYLKDFLPAAVSSCIAMLDRVFCFRSRSKVSVRPYLECLLSPS